jgi:hypothetical protein
MTAAPRTLIGIAALAGALTGGYVLNTYGEGERHHGPWVHFLSAAVILLLIVCVLMVAIGFVQLVQRTFRAAR